MSYSDTAARTATALGNIRGATSGLPTGGSSIIDLATGDQPMRVGEDWIVFNGEIYNFLELRAELGPELFRTSSDTEVILHAYRRWGPDCVESLSRDVRLRPVGRGAADPLLRSRPVGIKPLYYTVDRRLLSLRRSRPCCPSRRSRPSRLRALRITSPSSRPGQQTLFRGIQELLPGTTRRRPAATLAAGGQVLGGLLQPSTSTIPRNTSRQSSASSAGRRRGASSSEATSPWGRSSAAAWTRAGQPPWPRGGIGTGG